MTRAQYMEQNRANRITARKAAAKISRVTRWQTWAMGMLMLRSLLAEEAEKLKAIAAADWKMDRIMPKNWGR
jgi:hypothetical protein